MLRGRKSSTKAATRTAHAHILYIFVLFAGEAQLFLCYSNDGCDAGGAAMYEGITAQDCCTRKDGNTLQTALGEKCFTCLS